MSNQTILSSLRARGLRSWQAKFVASFLEDESAPFQLLSGSPGAGKMHSCVTIISELTERGSERILVLSPASLCELWRLRINDIQTQLPVLLVNRQVFREMEAVVPIGQSPWDTRGIFVLSQDLAKQGDFVSGLSAVTWDLVIVDEAHRMASPRRGALLDQLVAERVVRRLLLLTPTSLPALETWIHSSPGQLTRFPKPLVFTNWHVVLEDWDGLPINLPMVDLEVVSFTRGADEIKFLSEFLKMIPALAVGVPSNLEPFFSRLLNYRAASSLFAIEQSLQRLKLRFESQIGFSETASIDSDIDQPESDSDLDEVDLSTPPDLDEWTTERTSGLLVVEQLLEALDKVTSDEKLKATKRLIRLIVDSRTDRMPKICIFSTYADTVLYLHSATDDLGINLFKATGVSRLADRQAAISQFLEQGGLLIGTNAGLEGTTLEQVTHVIHYDLPSDPRALDQRVGRFDRYGRGEPYTAYVLRDGSGVIDFEVTSVDSIVSLDRTKIRG